jgi:hypothetical protein
MTTKVHVFYKAKQLLCAMYAVAFCGSRLPHNSKPFQSFDGALRRRKGHAKFFNTAFGMISY